MDIIDKFIEKEEGSDLKIYTLCPSVIFGPILMESPGSTPGMLKKFFDGSMPMVADLD